MKRVIALLMVLVLGITSMNMNSSIAIPLTVDASEMEETTTLVSDYIENNDVAEANFEIETTTAGSIQISDVGINENDMELPNVVLDTMEAGLTQEPTLGNLLSNGEFINGTDDWRIDWAIDNSDYIFSQEILIDTDESNYLNLKMERISNDNPYDYWPSVRHDFTGELGKEYELTLQYRINEINNDAGYGGAFNLAAFNNDYWSDEHIEKVIDVEETIGEWQEVVLTTTFTQITYSRNDEDRLFSPCIELVSSNMNTVGDVIDIDIKGFVLKEVEETDPISTQEPTEGNLLSNGEFINGIDDWRIDWAVDNADFSYTQEIVTDTDETNYLNLKMERIGNDNPYDYWPAVRHDFTGELGIEYELTLQYRINEINNDAGYGGTFNFAAFNNDYWSDDHVEKVIDLDETIGEWQEVVLTTTFTQESYVRNGEENLLSPCIELVSSNMNTVGDIIDIDIKGFVLKEVEETDPISTQEPTEGNLLSNGEFINGTNDWRIDWAIDNTDFSYSQELVTDTNETNYLNLKMERISNDNPYDYWPAVRHDFTGELGKEYELTLQYRINDIGNDAGYAGTFNLAAFNNDYWSDEHVEKVIGIDETIGEWQEVVLTTTFTQSTYSRNGDDRLFSPCVEIISSNMDAIGDVLDIDIKGVILKEVLEIEPTKAIEDLGWVNAWDSVDSDFITSSTVLTDDNGEEYIHLGFEKVNDELSGNYWPSIYQNFTAEDGKTYKINFEYRVTEGNQVTGDDIGIIKVSTYRFDYSSDDTKEFYLTESDVDGNWKTGEIETTFTQSEYDNPDDGNAISLNPCIEIFGNNMDEVGDKLSIDLKRILIEEVVDSEPIDYSILDISSEMVVLTKNESPYYFSDQITIPYGTKVIIEPGVTLIGDNSENKNDVRIIVEGDLEAKGSIDEPITFTSVSAFESEYNSFSDNIVECWQGMEVKDSGSFKGEYNIINQIQNDQSGTKAIIIENEFSLISSYVHNIYDGIIFSATNYVGAEFHLENNTFEGGENTYVIANIETFSTKVSIINNMISNSVQGIKFGYFANKNAEVKGNEIYDTKYPFNLKGLKDIEFVTENCESNNFHNNTYNYLSLDVYLGYEDGEHIIPEGKYVVKSLTTAQGSSLVIKPGTELYMEENVRIRNGSEISAIGTVDKNITFSSVSELQENNESFEVFWGGLDSYIIFPDGELPYKTEYRGDFNHISGVDNYNVIDANTIRLRNSYVNGEFADGVISGDNLEIIDCNLIASEESDEIISLDTEISDSVIIRDTRLSTAMKGIELRGLSFYEFEITNCDFDNLNIPIEIDMAYSTDMLIDGITDNVYSNNLVDGIFLQGQVESRFVLPEGEYYVNRGLHIADEGELIIEPGTTIFLEGIDNLQLGDGVRDMAGDFSVYGKMYAVGTVDKPIYFISGTENSIDTLDNGYSRFFTGINVFEKGEYVGEFNKFQVAINSTSSVLLINNSGKFMLLNSKIEVFSPLGENNKVRAFSNSSEAKLMRIHYCDIDNVNLHFENDNQITIDGRYNYYGDSIQPNTLGRVNVQPVLEQPTIGGQFFIPYERIYQRAIKSNGTYAPTGNYSYQKVDMEVPMYTNTITLTRTYNSQTSTDCGFGNGWSFNYYSTINDTIGIDDSKTIMLPDGSTSVFDFIDGDYVGFNNRNTLEEDGNEFILTTKDQKKYHFNSDGYLYKIVDSVGNELMISVDKEGEISNVIDFAGRLYNFTYENGHIKTISEQSGMHVEYFYEADQLIKVINSNNEETDYTYNKENGLLTLIENSEGHTLNEISYKYYSNNYRVYKEKDELGNINTYTYDDYMGKTTITDSSGYSTVQWYDGSYSITTKIDKENLQSTIIYSENTDGINQYFEPIEIFDRNGNTTTYERDLNGNIAKEIFNDDTSKSYEYDSNNNLIYEEDELGNITQYLYDEEMKLLLHVIKPKNGKSRFVSGIPTESDRTSFNFSTYEYYDDKEIKGLVKSTTDERGNTTTYEYDQYGNRKSVTTPEGVTTSFLYNGMGQIKKKTTDTGYVTVYTYDINNQLETETTKETDTSAAGETIKYIYDDLNRLEEIIQPEEYMDGDSTTGGMVYTYMKNGKVESVTDPEGNKTTYIYDDYGNVTEETLPSGGIYIYTYDALQRRLTKKFKEDDSTQEEVELEKYTYNINLNGTTTTTQTVFHDDTTSSVTSTVRDFRGNILEITYPNNEKEIFTYLDNGLMNTSIDRNQNTTH